MGKKTDESWRAGYDWAFIDAEELYGDYYAAGYDQGFEEGNREAVTNYWQGFANGKASQTLLYLEGGARPDVYKFEARISVVVWLILGLAAALIVGLAF